MNAEIKKRWVEALRSGEYAQLVNNGLIGMDNGVRSYCVLGVLNDLSGLGDWNEHNSYVVFAEEYWDESTWLENLSPGSPLTTFLPPIRSFMEFLNEGVVLNPEIDFEKPPLLLEHFFHQEEECLHPAVAKWAGLDTSPKVRGPDGEINLYELNDQGVPFNVLAELIEEQL